MTTYRSLATLDAIQYHGEPIPGVTCDGNRDKYGCDSSRAHLTHVHTRAIGGITVLKDGDWIMRSDGGPFAVAEDAEFRKCYEVPQVHVSIPSPKDNAFLNAFGN